LCRWCSEGSWHLVELGPGDHSICCHYPMCILSIKERPPIADCLYLGPHPLLQTGPTPYCRQTPKSYPLLQGQGLYFTPFCRPIWQTFLHVINSVQQGLYFTPFCRPIWQTFLHVINSVQKHIIAVYDVGKLEFDSSSKIHEDEGRTCASRGGNRARERTGSIPDSEGLVQAGSVPDSRGEGA
jgi:hypothetical protein